jgi:hypothetical protein
MLKISIVMLTTAGFAGLLIADPYGPVMSAARRTTVVAANAQAVPAAGQTQPSAVAKPIEPQNSPVVQEAPATAVVASKTEAPALTGTPTRPQLAGGFRGRRDRAVAHRFLHMVSANNVAHHVRRHA